MKIFGVFMGGDELMMRAGAGRWNFILFFSRGDFALGTKKAKPEGFAF